MGNILIDDAKFVKEQYKNSSGLSTRIESKAIFDCD